jgi:hypothetical protein
MARRFFVLGLLVAFSLAAGPASDLARVIRENSFDREQCYRVRDLSLVKEDIKIYLTDGHLIFSKPVAGHPIAAVFVADVEGGDAEVILLPPDRGERRSLATYTQTPNLDEHFHTALFLFTGNDYDALLAQFPSNPANKRTPEVGPMLDEQFTPTLRNIGNNYLTRLVLDLLNRPTGHAGLFAAFISGATLGNFVVGYDPANTEQIAAGQVSSRDGRVYFESWTSFAARSERRDPHSHRPDFLLSNYRIAATINPDLSLDAVTRVAVEPAVDGLRAAAFDITPEMTVASATVDGRPAEVLQLASLRSDALRGGEEIFLVVPPEPLRAGRKYEFEFHHAGTVVHDAGERVFFVSSRLNWYPSHGLQFATYDLTFRCPSDLDLAAAGELLEDRTEGAWHITHRRTSSPIRNAGFNLGDYVRARVERGGYVVEVCANRALERSLRPEPVNAAVPVPVFDRAHRSPASGAVIQQPPPPPPPNPLARLQALASDVASAMEFMAARFGPPALPHLTVSPIPGTFGQGFPGLIYLSTLAYLRTLPGSHPVAASQSADLFFRDILEAHETAHQWWGNRVAAASYRDDWLMEALANYSALLYLEKTRGPRAVEATLDGYRTALLAKGPGGQPVDSAGPIIMGGRLDSPLEPAAWRAITYGKGTWIMQMLCRRMGEQRFLAMLVELLKQYDHREISTGEFRLLAARFLPPHSDDPQLEDFFDQWVYSTGIPTLKMSYTVRGKAPALRLLVTVTQSDVEARFAAAAPVEVRLASGRVITHWVRCGPEPATFQLSLEQAPLKVTLDPNRAVLRR